ncbi:imm11 family protein, partial [Hyphomonas sp. L-53-1-40]|uniref:imm11 family protein n=1 Tax=Hyphomonas sp. L-53-1-40 TaxID=1207058 RepID=UPI0005579184
CLLARPEGTSKLLSLFEDQLSARAATYDEALLNDIAPQLTAMDVTVVLDAIDLERSSYSIEKLGNGYFLVNKFKSMHLRPEVTKGQLLFRLGRAEHKVCVAKSVFPELEAVSPNIRFKSLVALFCSGDFLFSIGVLLCLFQSETSLISLLGRTNRVL